MAERRMFAKSVVESDGFCDLPLSSQALYFHLSMYADDDGFVDSPNKIRRAIGASNSDMETLVNHGFVIPFRDSGIFVITHWRINNYLRSDRYKPTIYQSEIAQLSMTENGLYAYGIPNDNQAATNGQPNDNRRYTQYREGKDSIGKDSIGEYREGKASAPAHAHTRESFCEAYGIAANAEPPTDMDFDKLTEAYSSSTLLRNPDKPYFHSMKWIIKNYAEIIAGKYRDFEKSKADEPRKPSGKYHVEVDA